ncbi:hypothetical protein RIE95_07605 [Acidithiobacillus thiooxidans]|jgi:hypothetical protein|uniref:hypothetical protein n=1 Tax=Acidithiobacillus TaxID=119977 RepID=UPI001C074885|nr:hypothetical protein [Acidithiobacillus thiooxidans]MBU2844042.1 hypothetical protein [Acidithiobacillus thiooxidans]MDR7926846.1 hypothetical protein [Acidithiobacillus thiooxidans]MDX5934269.1 hypothetical protein [Acidithiobacillus thiooxidans]
MVSKCGNQVINWLMVVSIIATIIIAAIATGGATGYTPDPFAWFYTLIVPVFLMLIVTAYYNEKEPY